jgi:tetratricopeptide (TPR) repeat protein
MYTRIFLYLLFIAFVSGCSLQFNLPFVNGAQLDDYRNDARALSKEAYDLILKNDYEAAIVKAELAVKKDPGFGEAQKNLALAYCESGRVEAALEPAQKAVMLSPDFDKAHYVLAKVLFKLGRFSEAITKAQDAIRVNPKYDKAYFLMGRSYDLLNKFDEAKAALDQAAQFHPDSVDYLFPRDYVVAYATQKKQATLPTIVSTEGQTPEHASMIYSGIFYEALIHRDFDLIEQAADEARASKEKLVGGTWKLQAIYLGLKRPFAPTSDYDWNQHLALLKQWSEEKPKSITAKIALAGGYVAFAWHARGYGFANTVSEQSWKLFYDRQAQARSILSSVGNQPACPKWYALMLQIALGQGWDDDSYEKLFSDAVKYEPTWYEYYKEKAIFLLPQWHGSSEAVQAYVNSFAQNKDGANNAMLYFLVHQCAGFYSLSERHKPAAHYDVLKRGFLELRRTHGAATCDINWACYQAFLSNDRTFSKQLFVELKGGIDTNLWPREEMIEFARAFTENK